MSIYKSRPVYKTTSKLERYLTSIHGTPLLLDKLNRGEVQIFYVSTEIPYHIVQKQLKDYIELTRNIT